MPASLLKLPQSEYRTLRKYYFQVREQMEQAADRDDTPTDGFIQE